ncbi:unnamed protein product, partial [Rotaria socialis]
MDSIGNLQSCKWHEIELVDQLLQRKNSSTNFSNNRFSRSISPTIRIQVAVLSETCMCNAGVKVVNDYTMIYSGAPHEMKTRKAPGVAICLDQIAAKVWKDSGSEWEPISERIVKIRLQCTPIHITVIAAYSPINPTTKEMANESDKFYSDLQDTINNVSTKDMIIIMGD